MQLVRHVCTVTEKIEKQASQCRYATLERLLENWQLLLYCFTLNYMHGCFCVVGKCRTGGLPPFSIKFDINFARFCFVTKFHSHENYLQFRFSKLTLLYETSERKFEFDR